MSRPPRLERLIRDLASYVPFDAREAEHRRRMLEFAKGPSDPFDRTSFDPGHFTASAFVLSPDREALLLVFHGKLRKWLQPGGHIDSADEDASSAARRETAEETGLVLMRAAHDEALFDLDVHPIPARPAEPAHEHFDVRLLFIAESDEAIAGSDALEVKWVPLAKLRSADTDESVARAVAKLSRS